MAERARAWSTGLSSISLASAGVSTTRRSVTRRKREALLSARFTRKASIGTTPVASTSFFVAA